MSKKIIQQKTTTNIDRQTGEILEETSEKMSLIDSEHAYIKLYLADIERLYDLPTKTNSVIYELLKRIQYEDGHIHLTTTNKKTICEKAGYKMSSLNNYLSMLVKKDILKRIGVNVFEPNPFLFGKGRWTEIQKRRNGWFKMAYSSTGERTITTSFTPTDDSHQQINMQLEDA